MICTWQAGNRAFAALVYGEEWGLEDCGQSEIKPCNPSLQPTKILRCPGRGSFGCDATYAFASARYRAVTAPLLSPPRTCASACFTAGRAASASTYCPREVDNCCLMGRRVQYTTTCRQVTS